MRYVLSVLAMSLLAGCSLEGDGPNTAPLSTGPQPIPRIFPTFVWGMVVDGAGVCIPGATVRVAAGQHVGESLTQVTPCDVWSYDNGFLFRDVTPGVSMTLVVTAPYYGEQQKTIVPTSGSQTAFLFTPPKN